MTEEVQNLDVLLPEEKLEIGQLYVRWFEARKEKEYAVADKLRLILSMRGIDVNDKLWHPAFEHNLCRQRRAALRFAKYGTPIYPWGDNL